ncbi:MAG TPA: hypothetical protein VK195_03510, partial [Burkholderiaceae bacterium]|nr:hypothetical protein [Burkholderiaceae bacterium]
MDTRHQQYRRNWAWVGLAAASFLALAAFGWQEGRDSGPGETAEGRPEPAAPAWQAAAQASAAGTAASGPVLGGTARAPQDRPELRRTTSMVVADWGRYPAGLTDAIAQALREQDGPGAYELVRILSRCEGLPQEIERARQQLSELQAQGVLKPMDRDFVRKLMDLL